MEWNILCELSKKKTVVDKFLIHNFMNIIQSYDIPLSSICLTSPVAFPFAILVWVAVCYFNDQWCRRCFLHSNNRDWYLHLLLNCKLRIQTQLNNLVNTMHKKALKFTYDDKGNNLNDITPRSMKTCYQILKSCFALSLFFLRFLNMQ